MTVLDDVKIQLGELADSGEPESGVHGCLRCGRTEGVLSFVYRTGQPDRTDTFMAWERVTVPGERGFGAFETMTVCPCCSFDSCPHVPRLSCDRCGRPMGPPGYWATRCETDGVHPGVAA